MDGCNNNEENIETASAIELLDKYDFSDFLMECYKSSCRDISEIQINEIPNSFNKEVTEAVWSLSLDEFLDYLIKRYKIRYTEETRYNLCMFRNEKITKHL